MSDGRPIVTAQARNALCPCGSGLRVKHCCGRSGVAAPVYPGWAEFTPEARAALWQTMQRALIAQRAGQLDTARSLYEEVVARAPLTSDAVHMLGVVHLQQGDLDVAEALLLRALDLMPTFEAIRHNLLLLQREKREREGLYSMRAITAADLLRLFGATGRLPVPSSSTTFFATPQNHAVDGRVHVVVPGDVVNAAANQNGIALASQLRGIADCCLWVDPEDKAPKVSLDGAVAIDAASSRAPAGGTIAIFGISAGTLAWLPPAALSFESIVVALDVHDPDTCVDLFDRLPREALARVRLVARCPELLADLGLPGAVDPMVFGAVARRPAPPARPRRCPRVGVFIPPVRAKEDALRWEMIEWLRAQGAFLRLLYAGRLPSRHLENDDEHLVSLVTDWDGWWHELDILFFWGAEGRMRGYDRLVFEGIDGGLAIVADGYGDYGAVAAQRADCALFFDITAARAAMTDALSVRHEGCTRMRAVG